MKVTRSPQTEGRETAGISADVAAPKSEAGRLAATRMLLGELADRLSDEPADPSAPKGTCPAHMGALARKGAQSLDLPLDKISRWLGFIQGVMTVRGLLAVDEERDRTRPAFHAAYEADGLPKPPTIGIEAKA